MVLVKDAAEAVSSAYVQPGEVVGVGDRFGQWVEGPGIGQALVRSVLVVEGFVLA